MKFGTKCTEKLRRKSINPVCTSYEDPPAILLVDMSHSCGSPIYWQYQGTNSKRPVQPMPGKLPGLLSASCVLFTHLHSLTQPLGSSLCSRNTSGSFHTKMSSQDPKSFQKGKHFHVFFPPACTFFLLLEFVYSVSTHISAQPFLD